MEGEENNRAETWMEHIQQLAMGNPLERRRSEKNAGGILRDLDICRQEFPNQNEKMKQVLAENMILRQRCQSMFEEAPAGYVVMDGTGIIKTMNSTFARLVSISDPEKSHGFSEFVLPDYWKAFQKMLLRVSGKGTKETMELGIGNAGNPLHVMISCNLYRNPERRFSPDGASLVRGVVMDVSEMKRRQSEFFYNSTHDPMTGIYNRRYYDEQLEEVNQKASLPLAVGMIDLDGLKLINDSLGHEFGDRAITTVIDVIKEMADPRYILIRIGGDEFLLLFPRTELKDARNFLHEAKEKAKLRILSGIPLTFSWGAAVKRRGEEDLASVIALAEDMMYSRKLLSRGNSRANAVSLISRSLFEKNPQIKLHSYRVARLLRQFAEQLGYDENAAKQFFNLGLLHDIGMSSISEEILNKESPFTQSDWKEIQRHPEISYRILSAAPGLEKIAEFSLYHHERWDGTGYPGGVKGKKIPMEARTLAIVDSYDRMKYQRHGQSGLSAQEIREELLREEGRQFDPDLMDRFLTHFPPSDASDQ